VLPNTLIRVAVLPVATTAPGACDLTVSAEDIATPYGMARTGGQSVGFTVQPAAVATGPRVVSVQRFGFRAQPTSMAITINQDLNPTSASNPNSHESIAPGTANGVPLPIASATCDAATRTVTLVPAHRLSLFEEYMLIVREAGPNAIAGVNGVALDGMANGRPGSNIGNKTSHVPNGQLAL
jgi:hypothetical protein